MRPACRSPHRGRLLLAVTVALSAGPATAEPWRELWAGVDASAHVWLFYSGVTVAPNAGLFENGLRLRAATGYGGYTYFGERRGEAVIFNATTGYAEAMIGYLQRYGPLTAKAFVGFTAIKHEVEPLDPENPVQGQKYGPKIATEFWLNMGPSAWGQLDASWTSAHSTAAARTRVGYRIYGDISLGVEGAFNSNDMGEDVRGGGFVRWAWTGGELSLAGGFAGRYIDASSELSDPYATVNWLTQF
jgi:hypothetical protein